MGVKKYRVWCIKFRRVITSRYVVYNEYSMVAYFSVDIVVTNSVGSTHDDHEKLEPLSALKAPRVYNETY